MNFDVLHLCLLCFLISVSTFGGGSQALFYQYAVNQYHWLTPTDLSSALAFGYATPGPAVFGSATFIGYHLGGVLGAIIATVAVFVIPFLAAFLAARYLSHILKNSSAQLVIRNIGLAAAGLIAATALSILSYKTALPWEYVLAVVSFFLTLKYKLHPIILLGGGLLIGIAI